ncbi:MAG TPA: hypothetical protein DCZ00_05825 [Lactococcus sp.]|uniref:hypothetical protein n=1 Tax=Lactococcus TaxID=1357 RepID=UPI000E85FECD|nr:MULTISPECIES: hypothetical protein [Lactococcus]HBC90947.1 hypothetical protein [Lactococcus sp.]
MNYEKFFSDVKEWIEKCNSQAIKLGFFEEDFWTWVIMSLGELSTKYNNHPLAMKQTFMLMDWLDDTYKEAKDGA